MYSKDLKRMNFGRFGKIAELNSCKKQKTKKLGTPNLEEAEKQVPLNSSQIF